MDVGTFHTTDESVGAQAYSAEMEIVETDETGENLLIVNINALHTDDGAGMYLTKESARQLVGYLTHWLAI